MKNLSSIVAIISLFAFACGGTTTTTPTTSDVTVTFAPVDDATDQALDVAVTATFSGAITEPSDWTTSILTLKAGGAGDNLCTSVTYDSSTKVATCSHANLSRNTSYTIAVSGLTDADSKTISDASASFTTTSAEASVVSSMSKTSNTSVTDGSGSVALTFTFAAAVPASTTPTVTVATASANLAKATISKAISADTCEFNSDRTQCTSTVTGLNGCTSITDYTVTVAGGNVTEYTTTFNSADDEFNTTGTIASNAGDAGYCWGWNVDDDDETKGSISYTLTSEGEFKVSYTTDDEDLIHRAGDISKIIGGSDIAFSIYVTANNYQTDALGGDLGTSINIQGTSESGDVFALQNQHSVYQGFDPTDIWQINTQQDDETNGYAVPSGLLADTAETKAPFYVCFVRYNGNIIAYISFDGSDYLALTSNNMSIPVYSDVENLASILNGTAAADPTTLTELSIESTNYVNETDYSTEFDYVRFNATGITGVAGDCPAF